jgi:photosystem II CP47 chlorophyll apoprotein
LFRAGSVDNGDEITIGWLRHILFKGKKKVWLFCTLYASFYWNIPIALVNGDGIVRADVSFWRVSKYSVEQVGVIVELYGGELNRVSYSTHATVKKRMLYAHN